MTYQLSPQYKRNMDDLVEVVDGADMFIQYGHWTLQYGKTCQITILADIKINQNPNVNGWNTAKHQKNYWDWELFAAIGLLKTLAMQYTVAELTGPQAQITDWFTLPTDIFINKYDDYITNGWIVITVTS